MQLFKKLRNDYVIWHANKVKIPQFTPNCIIRQKITFSGRVQKVGFRLEIYCIARRMNLTGWVKNLIDGSVEAEFQGEASQIDFLVNSMKSLKRASIKNITTIDLSIREDNEGFTIVE
ncbi:MAG: acylphosphatase [Candidatus Pristimantibacillus lignocellulolyticus]|uniref:acylphosphatase n=1 Tax=Candidatus Pristimantibacillus lignocellulolyticus TaxID=2994561 RepID=A0A9J6ZC16_9BACL|nr:MAG: acylphosphatase [Candidatus Pristimantibacillus lignocellulolyticus]